MKKKKTEHQNWFCILKDRIMCTPTHTCTPHVCTYTPVHVYTGVHTQNTCAFHTYTHTYPPIGTPFKFLLLEAPLQEHQLSLCWIVLSILNVN